MPTVIFLKGSDADARHQWSNTWAGEGCNRIRICREDLLQLINPRFWREGLSVASAACMNMLINGIKTEHDIVVDAPNQNKLEYNRMMFTARKLGAIIIWRDLDDSSPTEQETDLQTDSPEEL